MSLESGLDEVVSGRVTDLTGDGHRVVTVHLVGAGAVGRREPFCDAVRNLAVPSD